MNKIFGAFWKMDEIFILKISVVKIYDIKCAKLLLEYGFNVNSKDTEGRTLLYVDVYKLHHHGVYKTKGPDPNIQNNLDHTPIHYGSFDIYDSKDILKILLDYGAVGIIFYAII